MHHRIRCDLRNVARKDRNPRKERQGRTYEFATANAERNFEFFRIDAVERA
jgi:hypothetical protein